MNLIVGTVLLSDQKQQNTARLNLSSSPAVTMQARLLNLRLHHRVRRPVMQDRRRCLWLSVEQSREVWQLPAQSIGVQTDRATLLKWDAAFVSRCPLADVDNPVGPEKHEQRDRESLSARRLRVGCGFGWRVGLLAD